MRSFGDRNVTDSETQEFVSHFEPLSDKKSSTGNTVYTITHTVCSLLLTVTLTSLYQFVPLKLCIAALRMICLCFCFHKIICYMNKCKYKLLKDVLIISVSMSQTQCTLERLVDIAVIPCRHEMVLWSWFRHCAPMLREKKKVEAECLHCVHRAEGPHCELKLKRRKHFNLLMYLLNLFH